MSTPQERHATYLRFQRLSTADANRAQVALIRAYLATYVRDGKALADTPSVGVVPDSCGDPASVGVPAPAVF